MKKRIKNKNQLEWLAERRKFKNKHKQPVKEHVSNIDYLFWQIAQERRKRNGGRNVLHG